MRAYSNRSIERRGCALKPLLKIPSYSASLWDVSKKYFSADVDAKSSILRTRLVPSKIIRKQKFTETAEENKVEQATVRHIYFSLNPISFSLAKFCLAKFDKTIKTTSTYYYKIFKDIRPKMEI